MELREITVSKFALIILLFLMPFVAVSCDGKPMMKLSGSELVSGKLIETREPFSGRAKVQEIKSEPYAIVAFAVSALGLTLLLIKGRISKISSIICSIAGFLSLLLLKFKIEADIIGQGGGMLSADFQTAFWLSLLLFVTIAGTNGYSLIRPATERSEAEKEQKNTFHFWYGGGLTIMALVLGSLSWNYANRPNHALPMPAQAVVQQPSPAIAPLAQIMSQPPQAISPSVPTPSNNSPSVTTESIDGDWQGTYESHGHSPTPFKMVISKPNNGAFDGSASEQIASGGAVETIQSKLTGAVNTTAVAFTKEFVFKGKQYSVRYTGTYDSTTKRIKGTWKSSTGNSHGSFFVWR